MKDVFPSDIMLYEESDAQKCQEHSKNYISCYLPIEGTLHPKLAIVLKGLPCFVCDEKKCAIIMLLCDMCQQGWHMTCLTMSLIYLPSGDWICPRY